MNTSLYLAKEMTQHELALWKKIESFQLDDQGASFKFSQRLARENGWTLQFTNRVIGEYKRFIFLCCISEKMITPSDAVDQAWHLHLTFTKSYWIEFCQETLGKQIHHNPTKGGEKEAEKFDECYTRMKQLYQQKFYADPPLDIWPGNEERFTDIDFERVNLRKFWLVRKPGLRTKRFAAIAVVITAGMISVMASGNGGTILLFLGVMIGVIILAYKFGAKDGGSGGSGCSTSACGADGGGHSGCGSGCSSGCGGGGCGGGGCGS